MERKGTEHIEHPHTHTAHPTPHIPTPPSNPLHICTCSSTHRTAWTTFLTTPTTTRTMMGFRSNARCILQFKRRHSPQIKWMRFLLHVAPPYEVWWRHTSVLVCCVSDAAKSLVLLLLTRVPSEQIAQIGIFIIQGNAGVPDAASSSRGANMYEDMYSLECIEGAMNKSCLGRTARCVSRTGLIWLTSWGDIVLDWRITLIWLVVN